MLTLLLACQPSSDPDNTRDPPADPLEELPEGAPPAELPDCEALPPLPAQGTPVEAFVPGEYAAVHEDFTFTDDGMVSVHLHRGVLQAASRDAVVTALVPGFEGMLRGITALDDGRLAIADPQVGALRLVDPMDGSQEIVGGGLSQPNGVALGPGGDLFVTTLYHVVRIAPDSADVEIVATVEGMALDGIAFSPDYSVLYLNQPAGALYASARNADGSWAEPVPFGQPLARSVNFTVADGMITDECGNLYVVGMPGALFRITPDGQLEGMTAFAGQPYELFTAARFGSGAGGWDPHTIYVTGLHGTVISVEVGVAGMPR